MSDSATPPPRAVRCETHGLLYNPQQAEGCVLCRREAGQPVQAAPATTPSDSSMARALSVSAALVLVTSMGFFSAHKAVIEMISGFMSGEALSGGISMEDMEEAGVDPRMQEVLDALDELEEIDRKRAGISEDEYDEGYDSGDYEDAGGYDDGEGYDDGGYEDDY